MVLKNGSVKVADFGIARVMSESHTLTREALGSVHYISPEQAKGGRVDDRSDIYSLGVVMYEMMAGRPPYDGDSPVSVAIQISKALEHAHSRGIVHRDIKPHNIMVLKNGSVKVADFGIARVMSKANTLTKEALGSVHYISPEQAKGGRVDDRSDLYSLGTVMYEMMTGRPPYDGESPVAVAIQHINGGAKMPSTLNPNIPGGLEQIIMKAMAHDPADRYASATAMLYDMDEFRKTPGMLFDYNTPPTDAVTRIQHTPEPVQPPRTTAQRVAATTGTPRRRPTQEQGSRNIGRTQHPSAAAAARRQQQQQRERDRNRIATIAVVSCSIVAIIAIVIFIVAILGGSHDSNLVSVPTLVGKSYETLNVGNDFVIAAPNYRHDTVYEKGQIIDQTPKPGDKVGRGTEIHIWVSLGPEPKVKTMENLVNQERTIAENFLTGQGVLFLCTEEHDDTVKEGYVIRTDPEAGAELKDGQTVMLYISKGPENMTRPMPRVEGQSLQTAKTILNNQNLELDIQVVEENSNTVEENVVIRSEPTTGEDLNTGDTVTLYVSKGPKKANMPDVLGEDVTTALKMLNAAGFSNITYDTYVESEAEKDTVVEQSVAAGLEVPVTTEIVLSLSQGPQPKETTKEVVIKLVENMGEAYTVTVTRKDTGEVIYDETVPNTEYMLELQLSGNGKITYVVKINGIWFSELEVDYETQ
jgi:serine/threonine-protein kinase